MREPRLDLRPFRSELLFEQHLFIHTQKKYGYCGALVSEELEEFGAYANVNDDNGDNNTDHFPQKMPGLQRDA